MPYKLNSYTNQRDYYVELSPESTATFLYTGNIYLKSVNNTVFVVSIANDGALLTDISAYAGFIPTYVLKSPGGIRYLLGMDNDGVLTTDPIGNYAVSSAILTSSGGIKYILGVDDDGAITTAHI